MIFKFIPLISIDHSGIFIVGIFTVLAHAVSVIHVHMAVDEIAGLVFGQQIMKSLEAGVGQILAVMQPVSR